MGMVVLVGLALMLLVASGLRQRVLDAIPGGLRRAIAIGIGLFTTLIGLVDSGFVTRNPDAFAAAPDEAWGLAVPEVPERITGTPDFSLVGEVGLLTGCLFVFMVLLSGLDAMGTVIGVGEEARLTGNRGRLPGMGRILIVDGAAVAGGGLGSCSAAPASWSPRPASARARARAWPTS